MEVLKPIVARCFSISEVLRCLGCKSKGTTHAHIKNRIQKFGLDTSHFSGKSSDISRAPWQDKLTWQEVLVQDRHRGRREHVCILRRALGQAGVDCVCFVCRLPPVWQGRPLLLEIDHLDGDPLNNKLENLRYLCPNCHTQTETFGFRGKKGQPKSTAQRKMSEDQKLKLRKVNHDDVRDAYSASGNYAAVGRQFNLSGVRVKEIVSAQ